MDSLALWCKGQWCLVLFCSKTDLFIFLFQPAQFKKYINIFTMIYKLGATFFSAYTNVPKCLLIGCFKNIQLIIFSMIVKNVSRINDLGDFVPSLCLALYMIYENQEPEIETVRSHGVKSFSFNHL